MRCPSCGGKTKRLRVHDEQPFSYSECTECSWDDYEEQYHVFRQTFELVDDDPSELDFNNDNEVDDDELEQNCLVLEQCVSYQNEV